MEKRSFSLEAMVRGYHVYRSVWEAAIGELMCVREAGNQTDHYAVAVVKPQSGELTVGHLPRNFRVCALRSYNEEALSHVL